MLKSAFDKWLGGSGKHDNGAAMESVSRYDLQDLSACIVNFKIGHKVSYYPAGRKDCQVEAEVLGYRINRKVAFARTGFELEGNLIKISGKTSRVIELRDVESFEYILPRADVSEPAPESETGGTSLGESPDLFAVNAKFSMIRLSEGKSVPSVDMSVSRVSTFEAGPLAGRPVVFLEPNVDSFSFLDRRKYRRIKSHIPIQVKIGQGKPDLECIIDDFSERHFRIISESSGNPLESIEVNQPLVLFIDLPESDGHIVLNCTVMHQVAGGVVVRLRGLLRDEVFEEITPLSEMSIKAALLGHPSAYRVLDF
ncbi:MAG: PilZ domain-containing protein [bacterium]|nr:PilZ domain-containing protein [bacterium]